MFSRTVAFDYDEKSAITPICNDIDSTVAAFELLTVLCNGCVENIRTLYGLLHNFFYTGTALCAYTVCIYGLHLVTWYIITPLSAGSRRLCT